MSLERSKKKVKPVFASRTTIRDIELKKAKARELPEIKKIFWEKPLGRTLKARNKAGKIVYSIVTIATGIPFLTLLNINIMDFADLNFIQIAITISFVIISGVIGLYVKVPGTKAKLNVIAYLLESELIRATDKASEGGKKITQSEIREIIKKVIGSIFG
jgi:hypothetical protein